MQEFDYKNATVRVHPSKLSEEEFRANLEAAMMDFYKEIQPYINERKTSK